MAKAKAKQEAEELSYAVGTEETIENRRALATAMWSVAACVRASGVDPFNLVKLRDVAASLGIPYVTAVLAYYSNTKGAPLTFEDLDEWEHAKPWIREVTQEVAREIDALYEGEEKVCE